MLPGFYLPTQAVVGIDWRVDAVPHGAGARHRRPVRACAGLRRARAAIRRDVLKEGGRGIGRQPGRKVGCGMALVVSEVALAFVLLVGAGLLIRSFNKLMDVDPGFNFDNIVTMNVPLIDGTRRDGARLTTYLDRLVDA